MVTSVAASQDMVFMVTRFESTVTSPQSEVTITSYVVAGSNPVKFILVPVIISEETSVPPSVTVTIYSSAVAEGVHITVAVVWVILYAIATTASQVMVVKLTDAESTVTSSQSEVITTS